MKQKASDDSAATMCCSEYEIANRAERVDAFLGDLLHLVFWVDKEGILHRMIGINKDLSPLDQEDVLGLFPLSGKSTPMPSLDAVFYWLKADYEAFVEADSDNLEILKNVIVQGKMDTYLIQFSRLVGADRETAGVFVSLTAKGEADRQAFARSQMALLEETIHQVRTCCHDFSQPLMVISGYVELMELVLPEDEKEKFDGFQQQIEKINRIFKTLRGVVLSCRQQMDLLEKKRQFNSLNVS